MKSEDGAVSAYRRLCKEIKQTFGLWYRGLWENEAFFVVQLKHARRRHALSVTISAGARDRKNKPSEVGRNGLYPQSTSIECIVGLF
jgi:hypothetical protein